VLHALRDVRQVDPHEGRDSLNVAESIPTLPATTAAPMQTGERFLTSAFHGALQTPDFNNCPWQTALDIGFTLPHSLVGR
jgi:hypothetical protein